MKIRSRVRSKFIGFVRKVVSFLPSGQHYELALANSWGLIPDRTLNPLTRNARKYFSQADEDGILLKCLERCGISEGQFVEFGTGNGLEANSLVLLALGWSGLWVGGERLAFEIPAISRLKHLKIWVTKDSIESLIGDEKHSEMFHSCNVMSLDLDGNDLYFARILLEQGVRPAVWIQEYNATFPPKVEWSIEYDDHHVWKHDSYWGASLGSFVKLFGEFGYRLVACSATGANAFFVDKKYDEKFGDVPEEIDEIYVPPLYFLQNSWRHGNSARTVASILNIS